MQVSSKDFSLLVGITTLIFILAPVFIILYLIQYNHKKKKHLEEKKQMQETFDSELNKARIEVQEQTMETIASDLHDNIGQLLSVTAITLASVNMDESSKALEKVKTAHQLITRSIEEMRSLAKLMQGSSLLEMGLEEAIQHELTYIEKTGRYKVNFSCEANVNTHCLQDKELILFRLCQELLNNCLKHSGGNKISVSLTSYANKLRLKVADNGIGFAHSPHTTLSAGIGLHNIERRAAILGGQIQISSNPDTGTTVEISIPYQANSTLND